MAAQNSVADVLPSSRIVQHASPINMPLSPFILDPVSVTLQKQHSKSHFDATWLHTRVNVRLVSTTTEAMKIVSYMNQLRHPNIELLLGVVIDKKGKMVVTEYQPGYTLADSFASIAPGKPLFSKHTILTISTHVARALVYLHMASGKPHPGLCNHAIVFDRWQMKAVVLLTIKCDHCKQRANAKPSRTADVAKLAQLIVRMFAPPPPLLPDDHDDNDDNDGDDDCSDIHISALVPPRLRQTLKKCMSLEPSKRPKMKELCNVLTRCLNDEQHS